MAPSLRFEEFATATATDRQVSDWAQLRRHRFQELNPGDPVPSLAEFERQVRAPDMPGTESGWVVAYDGDELVGFAGWDIDVADNPHVLWLDAYVAPARRRVGIGSRLIHRSLEVSAREGLAEVGYGLSGHVPVGQQLQALVEGSWGVPIRMIERLARLDLTTLDADRLEAELNARLARLGERHTPLFFKMDDLPAAETGFRLDLFCDMVEEIENLMPLEDLTLEPEHFTVEKFKAQVAAQRSQGREIWNDVLWDQQTGRALGLTNVCFRPEDPRRISQWATGVVKSAQGQGFGKTLKLLMTVRLLREVPGALFIDTENAASNEAMIAINTALGFREHYRIHDYQTPLADLKSRIDEAMARTAVRT